MTRLAADAALLAELERRAPGAYSPACYLRSAVYRQFAADRDASASTDAFDELVAEGRQMLANVWRDRGRTLTVEELDAVERALWAEASA